MSSRNVSSCRKFFATGYSTSVFRFIFWEMLLGTVVSSLIGI